MWAAGSFPWAGLVAHSVDLSCVLGEGGAFSAAQASPDATRTAWSLQQPCGGLWAAADD